ncbi:MAG: GNAT family N-acetyltransferase [Chloroflexi bacterium]|nr:MAG: GNAT family N-acetyltransferase [Chloroflexota bacterium]
MDLFRRRNTVSPSECHMSVIRRATVADAAVLARHRVEMFREMGQVTPGVSGRLFEASRAYFVEAISAERYIGWLYESAPGPNEVIGGVGIQLRELAPRPDRTGQHLPSGPEGYVLNVFTESQCRRQGVAESLMRALIAWATTRGVHRISLHASAEGRPLYEKLGFVPANEMRRDSV